MARGEAALEETLKSARELVAKYGDTAKAFAQDTAKLKDKATDTLIEQTETPSPHHVRGDHRYRVPCRLALSSALVGRRASDPHRLDHR